VCCTVGRITRADEPRWMPTAAKTEDGNVLAITIADDEKSAGDEEKQPLLAIV
jgi:hypothetical protein